jgi:hypothetical protein
VTVSVLARYRSPQRELVEEREGTDGHSGRLREVGSYRGAAQICGTTHKTVKRIVERHNAGGAVPPRKDRGHNYDEVRALVAGRVARSSGWISARRLLPAARAAGYTGSGAELPPAGRRGEGGVAGRASPRAPPGRVDAG